jgi:hypothetical protein
MTSIVQDIQTIRSLRKDIPVGKELPISLLKSVEIIHNCIRGGTDLNGWKKVDWRNGGSSKGSNYGGGGGGGSGRYSSSRNDSSAAGGGSNSFFNNRKNDSSAAGSGSNSFFNNHRNHQERSENSSQNAFGNRGKGGFAGRNEQPVSIPLTNNSNVVHNSNETNKVVTHSDGFRTVPQKYVSKFKKSNDKVEDTILNTILLGKLNKFSESNYCEIKEFITHIIDSGQTDMMKCFMKLVFEKAASEETFCPLYAKLLSELSIRYPILLSEMARLYSVYMQIFEEVPENKAENYNEVCKQNVEKKYRRGYSQFLAELIKYNVIDNDVFIKTINTIISQIELNIKVKDAVKLNEEYADCMMKIMNAIKNGNDSNNNNNNNESSTDSETDITSDEDDTDADDADADAKIVTSTKDNLISTICDVLKGDIYTRIQPMTVRNVEYIGLSTKTRFTLLDIYENIQKI